MKTEDSIKLKEEIFKEIRARESSLQEKMLVKVSAIEETNSDLVAQIEKINNTMKSISETIMTLKIKNQKIDEYVGFKNKMESFTLTHEVKINGILDEISKIKTKYDKIILDNIFVPGLIGPSCTYKSLGDFTSSQINDALKTKIEREQMRKDFKDYKVKVDTLIKNVVALIDNSVVRSNEYTENRVKHVKEFVEMKIYEFDKQNTDLKNEITEKQNKMDGDMENARNDFDQINLIKKELDELVKNKTEDFNNLETQLKTTTENYFKDISKIKTHMDKEDKNIKDSLKEAFRMIGEIRRKLLANMNNSKLEGNNNNLVDETDKFGNPPISRKLTSVFQSPRKYHQPSTKKINTIKNSQFTERKIDKPIIPDKEDAEKEKINKCDSNENLICLVDEDSKIECNEKESKNEDNINNKNSKEELDKKINNNQSSLLNDCNSGKTKQIENNTINVNETTKIQKLESLKRLSPLLEPKKNTTINNNLNNEEKCCNLKKINIKKNPISPKDTVNENKSNRKILDYNYNTINNHISSSSKVFGLKTYTNGFNNKKRKKYNNFKVISLDKKFNKNVNDVYTMTSTESVKKRSIKIDFSTPFNNLLKQYSKNCNQQNELQLAIKVAPAFGSTAYTICDSMYNNLRSSVKSNKIKDEKFSRNLVPDELENNTSSNF